MVAAKVYRLCRPQCPESERFICQPEMVAVLANDEHLAFAAGAFATLPSHELSDKLCQSFETGIRTELR